MKRNREKGDGVGERKGWREPERDHQGGSIWLKSSGASNFRGTLLEGMDAPPPKSAGESRRLQLLGNPSPTTLHSNLISRIHLNPNSC